MKKKFLASVGFILAMAIWAGTNARAGLPGIDAPTNKGPQLTCRHLDVIQSGFLHSHVNYDRLSDTLENRTIDQYIKRLDAAKLYFLKADVQKIKSKDMANLFQKLKAGDCQFLETVQSLLVTRVAERAAFAKATLEKKTWKFLPTTELVLDPDTRDFPKNAGQADKFQSKYLQFQVSNYIATGMEQKEAQDTVIHNYERVVKRVKETTTDDLFSGYLDSFGRALDPHSSFFSHDSFEDFNISMGLKLEGIGATLSSQDGFTVVEQLIAGGSAKSSGLIMPQDKIIGVGQFKADGTPDKIENVVEMDLRDVVRRIRGPKGSKVQLSLLRKQADGTKQRLSAVLTRDEIKLEEEAASISYTEKELNGQKHKLAVLNLPSFYAEAKRGGRSSASDMKTLIKEAREAKAEAMVLDLSNNGGGSLEDAVKIAGLFFKTGNVVKQSTHDRTQEEIPLDDKDATVDWDGPLVILTSRISASASEIVAGALKDYKRAVIVGGDQTFGKGSVQSVIPLPTGLGALKVTVGMFFTPGGFSTQHRGVAADVVLPGPYSTDEIGERFLDYSLPPAQIKPFLTAEAYVSSGPGAWKTIEKPMVEYIRARADARVAKNEEFQKIKADLKKAKERGKVIKLAESQKETKEKKSEKDKKKEESKAEKVADYIKRADVQEALNVLLDLNEVETKPALLESQKSAQGSEPGT